MTTLKETPAATHSVTLDTHPITETELPRARSAGRPTKLTMPALPKMDMAPTERDLFDFFMAAYQSEFPDMTPTDQLILHLAGVTYIKYLRLIAEEISSGKIVSMSRQHPGVELRSLLDQLSFTRKQRVANKRDPSTEEEASLREMFMAMSQGKKTA